MFANFLYFIIALLILTLYEPTETPPLTLIEMVLLFFVFVAVFAAYTHFQFRRLQRQVSQHPIAVLDRRFTLLVTRHSILALCLFAADIWGLHLPDYLELIPLAHFLPTAGALLFLLIFVFYLTMVWFLAYGAHRDIYRTDISRRTYVYSNVAFSIPVLIPWALLFGISDLIALLPFDFPKRILETTFGQIAYFLTFLVIAAVFAPLLIRRFWRCHPLENGEHRRRIAELCSKAGVTYADIVYWPIFEGRMITAGVMGLVGRFRYILVTRALLRILSPEEIDQVIAHEIGHVKRKHLLLYLFFFIGFMLISYAVFPLSYYVVFFVKPVFAAMLAYDLNPARWVNILGGAFLVLGVIVYFRYVFGYFMRNFERQADLFVFRLFPTAQPLIATFDKIVASSGQPADKPNWHHFSIQQRIDYLRRSEQSTTWITLHDRKIRKSILAFLTGLTIVALGVFQLNQTLSIQGNEQFSVAGLEAYLDQKVELTPQDAPFFLLLGDLSMMSKEYAKAARSYSQALILDPTLPHQYLILTRIGSALYETGDHQGASQAWSSALQQSPEDPDLLNNLAWLLATSPDEAIYNPGKALNLAQQAIQTKKAPHIWDTYAEALFVNGRVEEALAAEEEALAMQPPDAEIYKKQLVRFREALKK
jgi:Zn-dependent protease with chaperone function/cytochrome c-type biogenesis protein CcmH/NrfG